LEPASWKTPNMRSCTPACRAAPERALNSSETGKTGQIYFWAALSPNNSNLRRPSPSPPLQNPPIPLLRPLQTIGPPSSPLRHRPSESLSRSTRHPEAMYSSIASG
jgi:hypothetical protein